MTDFAQTEAPPTATVADLTLEEKASLTSGASFWRTKPVERVGIPSIMVTDGPHGLRKQREGTGPEGEPTTVDAIMSGDIDLIINTPFGVGPRLDGYEIRTAAVLKGVPCITTIQGLAATVLGIESLLPGGAFDRGIGVRSLQEYAEDLSRLRAPGGA